MLCDVVPGVQNIGERSVSQPESVRGRSSLSMAHGGETSEAPRPGFAANDRPELCTSFMASFMEDACEGH